MKSLKMAKIKPDSQLPKKPELTAADVMEATETITITNNTLLTPETLSTEITPYIQSIFDFQQTIDQLNNKPSHPLSIENISQNFTNFTLSIELHGASAAIDKIRELLVPWWRDQAKRMAKMKEEQEKLDLQEKQLQLERHQLEFQKEKINLALSIIKQYNPDLLEPDRIRYVMELLKPLSFLTESPHKIQ